MPEKYLALKPSLDWTMAAALPTSGMTAMQSLRVGATLTKEHRVLINGASGSSTSTPQRAPRQRQSTSTHTRTHTHIQAHTSSHSPSRYVAPGGVGSYAVQLAKASGAHVTAVCSTRNADAARSMGADEVIDYTTTSVDAVAKEKGLKFDKVIDVVGRYVRNWYFFTMVPSWYCHLRGP